MEEKHTGLSVLVGRGGGDYGHSGRSGRSRCDGKPDGGNGSGGKCGGQRDHWPGSSFRQSCDGRWSGGGGCLVFPGYRPVSVLERKPVAAVLQWLFQQSVWNRGIGMGMEKAGQCEKNQDTISSVCMDGGHGLAGSYTVETAVLMTIVLLSMAGLVQSTYRQCRKATGTMRTHQMVEVLRHREEESGSVSIEGIPYEIKVEKKESDITGIVEGDGWSRSIKDTVFEPEAFMRMLTLIEE